MNTTPNSDTDSQVVNPGPKKLLKNSGNIHRVIIRNKQYNDRVVTEVEVPVGTGNPPIFGAVSVEDTLQIWDYDSYYETIQNKKTGLYAYPAGTAEGSRILVRKKPYYWDVHDQDGGFYSISPPGDHNLFWALADGDDYTAITLQGRRVGEPSWEWAMLKV